MSEDRNYLQRGYNTRTELEERGIFPPDELLKSKRLAVIECIEDIPCNPCEEACRFKGIHKETFTKPGQVDWENCNGCAACLLACPGLSVFLMEIRNGKGYVTLPYEIMPTPEIGNNAELMNRAGEVIGQGKIVAPTYKALGDATPRWVVTVEMDDPDFVYEVRAIKIIE